MDMNFRPGRASGQTDETGSKGNKARKKEREKV